MARKDFRIRTDQDLFDWLIGDSEPRFSQFSHLVVGSGPPTLASVRKTVGEDIGWWGEMPALARDGSSFVGNMDYVQNFRVWGTPLNQKWLREHGGNASLSHSSVYLPVRASSDLLRELREPQPEVSNEFIADWPILSKWLNRLRWTYLPLSDEVNLAIFVMSTAHDWIDTLKASCDAKQIPYTQVFDVSGGDRWQLTAAMRTWCRLGPR